MKFEDRLIQSIWFTTGQTLMTIGVIAVKTDMGGWKAYIGSVEPTNETNDAEKIYEWGTKLTLMQARGFFPDMETEKYNQ